MCELESMCRLYEDIAAGSIVTSSCFSSSKTPPTVILDRLLYLLLFPFSFTTTTQHLPTQLPVHLKGGAIETRTRFRLADRVSCHREFPRVYRTIHQLFSSICISLIILISIQSIFKC